MTVGMTNKELISLSGLGIGSPLSIVSSVYRSPLLQVILQAETVYTLRETNLYQTHRNGTSAERLRKRRVDTPSQT